jgi:hypothetical protein
MNRRTWVVVCLAVVLAFGVALSAGAQGKGGGGGKLGLVFNLWDLAAGTASSDGVLTGAGVKYWLADKMAIRGILEFQYLHNKTTDATTTLFGASGAFEYHFKTGRVSPYAGGLVGVLVQGGDTSDLNLLLGGLLGVEMRVMDSLGLFAEYSLSLFSNDTLTDIVLGAGNNASIGVVIYL